MTKKIKVRLGHYPIDDVLFFCDIYFRSDKQLLI